MLLLAKLNVIREAEAFNVAGGVQGMLVDEA
jgi:hypothetical protein